MNLTTIRIAWRNLSRNKRRTALAVGAIAIGQFTLVFVNGMMAGMFVDMIAAITGPLIGHVQIHHPEWREERAVDLCVEGVDEAVSRIEAMPGVVSVLPRIYSPVLTASGEESEEPAEAEIGVVVGVRFEEEVQTGGLLEELNTDDFRGGAALGSILANRLGVQEGELLAVIGQDADEFPVTELFEVGAIIDSPVELVKTMGIVIPIDQAQELFALTDQAHEVVVLGAHYDDADGLAAAVTGIDSLSDAEVLTWRQAIPELARLIELKGWIDFVFVGILFVAAAAGIANTAMMSTFERLREFGMLLALGAKPPRIVSMVLVESVLLGVVGVVIGSILGSVVVLITSRTGINYAAFAGSEVEEVSFVGLNISYVMFPIFQFRQVTYGFFAVSLTSIFASTWPAMLAARLEPVRALRS
jgi:ABC-type lipoprotein release transport system permease subunit